MKNPNSIALPVLLLSVFALTACQSNYDLNPDRNEVNSDGVVIRNKSLISGTKKSRGLYGTYVGILPCASCEGIESQVTLLENKHYSKIDTYLGASGSQFIDSGLFVWGAERKNIILTGDSGRIKYKVTKNGLLLLNAMGGLPQGRLANKYILKKL